jgi:hypothetical protein
MDLLRVWDDISSNSFASDDGVHVGCGSVHFDIRVGSGSGRIRSRSSMGCSWISAAAIEYVFKAMVDDRAVPVGTERAVVAETRGRECVVAMVAYRKTSASTSS